jgi:hypothetical protein
MVQNAQAQIQVLVSLTELAAKPSDAADPIHDES